MATNLVEKLVEFHGVWLVGHNINDQLLSKIGNECVGKPAMSCKLTLTTSGLSLDKVPIDEKKKRKTHEVSFSQLREICFSSHQPRCLIVIYKDEKAALSIMACTCSEGDVQAIVRTYQEQKKRIQSNRPASVLRTGSLKLNTPTHSATPGSYARTFSFSSSTRPYQNGYSPKNNIEGSRRHFSDGSDVIDGDVFTAPQEAQVVREPAAGHGSSTAFNVGVQTAINDADWDNESNISSSSSLQTLRDDIHSLSEEMHAIKFLLEKTTGISAEEYYRRRDVPGSRPTVTFQHPPTVHPHHNSQPPHHDHDASGAVGYSEVPAASANGKADDDYDLRSISAQTEKKGAGLRYTKKPIPASTSNAYKERVAALRTKSVENGNGSVPSPEATQPAVYNNGFRPRSSSASRTVVSRPIHEVYGARVQQGGSQRKKVVFLAAPHR
ncbi:uncharacterized protein LOC131930571 [Physella acuta]|uniref:uncharacterized protein LOC131930571 n=1 Tax=Physella acuta TaxID=109671 RepID=UPI0027DE2DD9|nr:uncharacterized protein LOC131930571 [Physella acuta]